METKINFKPVTHYYLTREELRRMYIALALSKYGNLRQPDYNEGAALERIRAYFKKLYAETQSLTELQPNNHSLHKILVFFHNQIENLSRIPEESEGVSK